MDEKESKRFVDALYKANTKFWESLEESYPEFEHKQIAHYGDDFWYGQIIEIATIWLEERKKEYDRKRLRSKDG